MVWLRRPPPWRRNTQSGAQRNEAQQGAISTAQSMFRTHPRPHPHAHIVSTTGHLFSSAVLVPAIASAFSPAAAAAAKSAAPRRCRRFAAANTAAPRRREAANTAAPPPPPLEAYCALMRCVCTRRCPPCTHTFVSLIRTYSRTHSLIVSLLLARRCPPQCALLRQGAGRAASPPVAAAAAAGSVPPHPQPRHRRGSAPVAPRFANCAFCLDAPCSSYPRTHTHSCY